MPKRSAWLWVMAIALAIGIAAAWYFSSWFGSTVRSRTVAMEVPVIIRTEGGLLEVATVKALERFSRSDTREFWGLSMGTTVSHIQAPAYYRYQVALAKNWQVVLKDNQRLVVQAPAPRASLPVALDMAGLQSRTQNGWARMNREENLAALQQSIGPELDRRAASSAYLEMAREPARKTIEEFVRKWVVQEQMRGAGLGSSILNRNPSLPSSIAIEVVFPDETEQSARKAAKPQIPLAD